MKNEKTIIGSQEFIVFPTVHDEGAFIRAHKGRAVVISPIAAFRRMLGVRAPQEREATLTRLAYECVQEPFDTAYFKAFCLALPPGEFGDLAIAPLLRRIQTLFPVRLNQVLDAAQTVRETLFLKMVINKLEGIVASHPPLLPPSVEEPTHVGPLLVAPPGSEVPESYDMIFIANSNEEAWAPYALPRLEKAGRVVFTRSVLMQECMQEPAPFWQDAYTQEGPLVVPVCMSDTSAPFRLPCCPLAMTLREMDCFLDDPEKFYAHRYLGLPFPVRKPSYGARLVRLLREAGSWENVCQLAHSTLTAWSHATIEASLASLPAQLLTFCPPMSLETKVGPITLKGTIDQLEGGQLTAYGNWSPATVSRHLHFQALLARGAGYPVEKITYIQCGPICRTHTIAQGEQRVASMVDKLHDVCLTRLRTLA